MFYRSGRNAAERMYRKLRSRHLIQAFASRHSLRRDVSTAMIYNPKDRSIPLPSLRRGGRRHRVSISAKRLRASCGRITELMEGAVAARAVQAEALRRIQDGLPQQDENPITEPRPKRPRGSRRGAAARGGAPRPNRQHVQVARNTSGSRRVTFAPQLVHYPPDRPQQYTTPKQEPLETLLHETTEFPPGLRQRVQQRLPAWEEIGAGSQVMSWLREGVRVPWRQEVPMEPFVREDIPLDPKDVGWVDGELRRQVASRAIEEPTCLDYVAPAFVVVQSSGKRRVVVDFDKLNKETLKSAFRYETLKSLRHLAKRGDWAISFDLEDGFHAIPIHPDDRKYFTFSIGGKVFQFAALPFGWTLSPFVFTKVMRPVVRFFRSHNGVGLPSAAISRLPRVPWRGAQVEDPGNVRCLPYMDDFLFLFATRELARMGAGFIDATLTALGLKRSIKKSVWEPTQQLQHLGLLVDFQRGLFLVPPAAVKSIQQQAKQLLISATDTTARVAVRRLAAFAGKVASVDLACPLARFRTRAVHDCIAVAPHWEAHVRLSRAARTDLDWWVRFDVQAQERAIWQAPCTRVLHADASGEIGWGAVLDRTVPASGFWRSHQQHEHITLKERRAVRYAVESFMPELANHIVLLYEDNQAVVAILMSGTSRSPELMRELRKLFDICGLRNITLRPQYIRSHLNVLADRLSRLRDHDDWKLNPRIF